MPVRVLGIIIGCLAAGFWGSLAQAEIFSFDTTVFRDSANIVFRDNIIEKDLEIEYTGIYETPSPTNIRDTDKEYRFFLRMKTFLGRILVEKNITISENSFRASSIDFGAYDRKSGKWQNFEDIQILVLPDTTGTQANIRLTGRGHLLGPKIEPFPSGAQQLDDYLKIRIKAEYLPPNTPAILSSSILKRVKTTGEVKNIGNFQFSGSTDAQGFLEIEKAVAASEVFDNRHDDIYTLTSAASHYFTFENSAITEQRTAISDLDKQISIADFELRPVSSEFYTSRAYFTFNDEIASVSSSVLTRVEEKTDKPYIRYGSTEKQYPASRFIFISMDSSGSEEVFYKIRVGDKVDELRLGTDTPLEISWPGVYRYIKLNGIKKILNSGAKSAKLEVYGGTPRVSIFDESGRLILEAPARDLEVSFDEVIAIPHEARLAGGGAVELLYAGQPTSAELEWVSGLESERRPGVLKRFILSGAAIYEPERPLEAVLENQALIKLQLSLIELLNQLIRLLKAQVFVLLYP